MIWRFGEKVIFWSIMFIIIFSLTLSEWMWRNDDLQIFIFTNTNLGVTLGSVAALILQKHQFQKETI